MATLARLEKRVDPAQVDLALVGPVRVDPAPVGPVRVDLVPAHLAVPRAVC